MFQSQPRCQAPGDLAILLVGQAVTLGFNLNRDARPLATYCWSEGELSKNVSISTEMPGPWRQAATLVCGVAPHCFNLNRDARPLATSCRNIQTICLACFNLNRDARP